MMGLTTRSTRPADVWFPAIACVGGRLPVEQPTKLELAINPRPKGPAASFGQRNRVTFHDVASINYQLGKQPLMAQVFVKLDSTNFKFANQCADTALSALVGSRLFELARRYVPEPFKSMEGHCARLNEDVDDLVNDPPSEAPRLEAYVCNYAVQD
jgi:hypothetical protein